MLFLLPPSESKQTGGGALTISQVALSFGALNPAREVVLTALEKLCAKPRVAAKALKLGPKQLDQLAVNRSIRTAPTMPAFERYTGTLYDALSAVTLSPEARARAKETVLVQTALFGLIPVTDLIPDYRLSANTALPRVNLRQVWSEAHAAVFGRLNQGLIVDLRSKAYVDLGPIPSHLPSVWVEVVQRGPAGELRALNHFNKKSKGEFIRAVLEAKSAPDSWADLSKIAKSAGFELKPADSQGVAYLVIG